MTTKKPSKKSVKKVKKSKTTRAKPIKTGKKEYTSVQIEAVIKYKQAFPKLSIRKIAKDTKIPKSVIGRWLKNPDSSVQKAQVKEIKKELKSSKIYTKTDGSTVRRSGKKLKEGMNKLLKKFNEWEKTEDNRRKIRFSIEGETIEIKS